MAYSVEFRRAVAMAYEGCESSAGWACSPAVAGPSSSEISADRDARTSPVIRGETLKPSRPFFCSCFFK